MSRILNNILCTMMIFGLTFAWAVYCLKDAKYAAVAATTVAICFCYVVFAATGKICAQRNKKTRRTKTLKNFFATLRFNDDNEALFEKLFEFFGYKVNRVDFDSAVIVREKQIFAVFCFAEENLTEKELCKAIVGAKRNGCKNLMIFCNKATNRLQNLANSLLPTKFADLQNTYDLFEQADKLPTVTDVQIPKTRFVPQYAFSRRRFGAYFGGAAFSLFTAAFSLLKIYLLVWSTALFLLALYCLFNKRFNVLPTAATL